MRDAKLEVIDCGPPLYRVPPWYHQAQAYDFIKEKDAALLYCGMGTGKSRVVIDLINNDEDINKVLILCPLSVCKAWELQFELYALRSYTIAVLDRGSVPAKAVAAEKAVKYAETAGDVAVIVINYESFWRPAFAKFCSLFKMDLMVADECFSGDARIAMPDNRSSRIDRLKVGDVVLGIDHNQDGYYKVVETTVKHVFKKKPEGDLYWWQGSKVTGNHPVWTREWGYIAVECIANEWSTGLRLFGDGMVSPVEIVPPQKILSDGGTPDVVYNIETGTGNYFANGFLVHNCHRIKSVSGKASRYAARVGRKAKKRLGLSGTPAANSPLDIYAQFRFLDNTIFGTSYTRFKNRYGVWGGFQGYQLIGLQNEAEFNKKFYSITFRADTSDVLDLPDEQHIPIPIELNVTAMRIYRELEQEFIADVVDGTVTVSNALTKLLRLQQVTSGHIKLDEDDKVTFLHGQKKQAIQDLLDGVAPGEPFVVFCRFTHDLMMVHDAAEAVGRSSLELSGSRRELERWQAGEADVLAVQIQSGAEGIDLTRACYAAYFSLGFSLSQYDQSLSRINRPGQKRKVTYYHLIAGGTVDGKVYKALSQKKKVIDTLLEDYSKTQDEKPDYEKNVV